MSSLVPSFRQVAEIPEGAAHDSVRKAIKFLVYSTVDLQQAIPALNKKVTEISSPSTVSSTVFESSSSGGSGSIIPGLGGVNNQTGSTAYTTENSDNGVLLILNDASAIAVTLNSGVSVPFLVFIANTGLGDATLTPSSGTISYPQTPGASSMPLPGGYAALVVFDGTNWWAWASVVPANTPVVVDSYLAAYDASTGQFTQTALPIATTLDPGMVEPDGTTISVSPTGVISAIGGAGNATSIQGVPVSAAAPTSGQVLEYNGTDWIPATVSGTVNFADNEQVSGSGTAWTLAFAPSPVGSLLLFQRVSGFGGVLLIQGTDYTLSGTAVTTTNSITAGTLFAWYRH